MATTLPFPPGLAPLGDGDHHHHRHYQRRSWYRDAEPLNRAVAQVLDHRPRGVPLQAIDPFVRWSTGFTLTEWVRMVDVTSSIFSAPDGPTTRPVSRADLLRRLPCVSTVDRIAGLSVVYPAASLNRLREHAPPPMPGQYALCASLAGKTSAIFGGTTVVVVDSVEACRDAVQYMRGRGTAIALDCEGTSVVRPNTISPGVALIQMAPRDGPCYLFDMCRPEKERSGRALMERGGLGALLSDRSVIKVVHDAREDARALAVAYRCALNGVFDTQIAYMEIMGTVDGRRPSLNAVLAACGLATNQHKDAMRAVYPFDLFPWQRRPVHDWMVEYAMSDVALLLALYDILIERRLSASSLPPPPWRLGPSITPLCGWTVVVAGGAAAAPRLCAAAPAAPPHSPPSAAKRCLPIVAGESTKGTGRRRHRRAAAAISH
ncbi:DnaQ like exonuclease [Pandoravirus quercus]|uniref:DnaQ like exonuclease n=1 Tax=Pandoravirus quercus TaxID=2107709 RepID=A0A2U7U968_9VIRU|nr:DnaQ like exonuclease [Pandoravirus quercus]AVK74993.1 DnaQ like exonuclease [Pandoravirus quercus]